jgi:hypothetical protein
MPKATYAPQLSLPLVIRMFRELVPAFLISYMFSTIAYKMIAHILGESMDRSIVFPFKSQRLDMMMFTVPLFWADKNEQKAENNVRVKDLVVYSNNMTTKANQDWRNTQPDDWWCLTFPSTSRYHIPADDDEFEKFGCEDLIKECVGRTGLLLWAQDFPVGDPGWRCQAYRDQVDKMVDDVTNVTDQWPRLISSLPGGNESMGLRQRYSFCIDVTAETKLYQDPWVPWDFWFIALLMPLVQLNIIINWICQKNIYACYYGGVCTLWKRAKFLVGALMFCCIAILSLISPPAIFIKAYPQWCWGKNKFVPFFAFGIAVKYTILALGSGDGGLKNPIFNFYIYVNRRWIFKVDEGDVGAKWPLDSDKAVCFFLVRGYEKQCTCLRSIKVLSALVSILYLGLMIGAVIMFPPQWNVSGFFLGVIAEIVVCIKSIVSAMRVPEVCVDHCPSEVETHETLYKMLKGFVTKLILKDSATVVNDECCRRAQKKKSSGHDADDMLGAFASGHDADGMLGAFTEKSEEVDLDV